MKILLLIAMTNICLGLACSSSAFALIDASNVEMAVKPINFDKLYDKNFADEQIKLQNQADLREIETLMNGAQIRDAIEVQAQLFKGQVAPISAVTALDILCGETLRRGTDDSDNKSANFGCELNPTYSYAPRTGFDYGPFTQPNVRRTVEGDRLDLQSIKEADKLKQILAVYQKPMDTLSFKKWLFANIVVFAKKSNRTDEVEVSNQQIQFSDQLLSDYFSDSLSNLSGGVLTTFAKFSFIEDAVTFTPSNRAIFTDSYFQLVTKYLRGGKVPIEFTDFQQTIGKYTFPTQLIYLFKATENQPKNNPMINSLEFYRLIFDPFAFARWTSWAELFATPDAESIRNVESWNDFLQIPVNPKNPVLMTRPFVDFEQRPNATPVSFSSAVVNVVNDKFIEFRGELGAIRSDSQPDQFVGFTGIEIDTTALQKTGPFSTLRLGGIAFDLSIRTSQPSVLTVQIVADLLGQVSTYEKDLAKDDGGRIEIAYQDFRLSRRGTLLNDRYDQSKGKIRKLRLFLKRSQNQPTSSELINVSMRLPIDKLIMADKLKP